MAIDEVWRAAGHHVHQICVGPIRLELLDRIPVGILEHTEERDDRVAAVAIEISKGGAAVGSQLLEVLAGGGADIEKAHGPISGLVNAAGIPAASARSSAARRWPRGFRPMAGGWRLQRFTPCAP